MATSLLELSPWLEPKSSHAFKQTNLASKTLIPDEHLLCFPLHAYKQWVYSWGVWLQFPWQQRSKPKLNCCYQNPYVQNTCLRWMNLTSDPWLHSPHTPHSMHTLRQLTANHSPAKPQPVNCTHPPTPKVLPTQRSAKGPTRYLVWKYSSVAWYWL